MRAFAREQGLALEWVHFGWPELAHAFETHAFDVAVGGITVRPERTALGRFTRPVLETGAVVLVRDAARFPDLASLAAARVAVNAGGHLEQVARALLPKAQVVAIADNAAPRRMLAAGEVDAALTDGAEAPLWLRDVPGAAARGPLTRDAKAWWVRADRPELASALDRFLAQREVDGTLARLRAGALGREDSPATAAPLGALCAALRERLELAPFVAEAKRGSGAPVSVPEQEERVLAAAVASTRTAAARADRAAPPEAAVRAFFRAQIDAGKEIQTHVLAAPAAAEPPLDLDTVLRPTLARVGEDIAERALALPASTSRAEIARCAEQELAEPGLSPEGARAIGDAIAALVAAAPAPP